MLRLQNTLNIQNKTFLMAIKTNILASKNILPIPYEFLQLYLCPMARLRQKPEIWNILIMVYHRKQS